MNSMRVLVMEPPNQQLPCDTARPNGALGPAYLVGALRAAGIEANYYDGTVGHPKESLDATFFNRQPRENGTIRYGASVERLAEVIGGYDVLALSSIFTAQTRMHFEAIRAAREQDRKILIVAGGVNAQALRKQFLECGADHVVMGDGEQEIVNIVTGSSRPIARMDDLPHPALEALPLETYRDLGIPHAGVPLPGTMFGAIQTSRGCQDRCSFCHISMEKAMGTGYLRAFSVERVRRDVEHAASLGITRLYFEDDNLFFSKRRLKQLAPVLKRPGMEYSNVNGGNLRFLFEQKKGSRHEVDAEFVGILADFGLKELTMPFESRSPAIMQQYATGKYDADVMDSAALVWALKMAGIRTSGNFMIGFPDEEWESVLRTREFAREMMAAGLDACGFMIPVPYPGSLDFERWMGSDVEVRRKFEADPLAFTDRMHWRAKPLWPTRVEGERLEASVRDWWEELNGVEYTGKKVEQNVGVQ